MCILKCPRQWEWREMRLSGKRKMETSYFSRHFSSKATMGTQHLGVTGCSSKVEINNKSQTCSHPSDHPLHSSSFGSLHLPEARLDLHKSHLYLQLLLPLSHGKLLASSHSISLFKLLREKIVGVRDQSQILTRILPPRPPPRQDGEDHCRGRQA